VPPRGYIGAASWGKAGGADGDRLIRFGPCIRGGLAPSFWLRRPCPASIRPRLPARSSLAARRWVRPSAPRSSCSSASRHRWWRELIANGRIPTAGIGIVPADDATLTGVDGVRPGSPAEHAGLRGANADSGTQGDIITGADGVAVRSPFLTHQLERVGIGGAVDLAVRRDGKTATMAVDVVDVDQPQRQ
jgi:hypothetical protein